MGIEKHLNVTATSTISWKDAIVQAVSEASKTIDYLSSVTVINQTARILGDKITEYIVDLDLSFMLDNSRRQEDK